MRDRLGAVFSHLRTYANNNTDQTPNLSGDINNVFEYSDVLSVLPPRKTCILSTRSLKLRTGCVTTAHTRTTLLKGTRRSQHELSDHTTTLSPRLQKNTWHQKTFRNVLQDGLQTLKGCVLFISLPLCI